MAPFGSLDARFTALVREHQASLRAFIRMCGAHPMWVDDLAQEAFIIAHRRLEDFDETRDFGAWLRGIARNLVANERRREGRRCRLIHPDLGDHLDQLSAECDRGPSDTVAMQEAVGALRSCLERLPERSQHLLRMRYEQDLDAGAMGEEIGRDANAVRQALFRIRDVLRQCLESRMGSGAWP